MSFKCTSCNVMIHNSEEQKIHYRLDWHRYNLKRKTANLPPITKELFDKKKAAVMAGNNNNNNTNGNGNRQEFNGKCLYCSKTFGSKGQLESHLNSKKHKLAVTEKHRLQKEEEEEKQEQERQQQQLKLEQIDVNTTIDDDDDDDVNNNNNNKEEKVEEEKESLTTTTTRTTTKVNLSPKACLFCDVETSCIDNTLKHMSREHGFFLPDIDYLLHLPDFLTYLNTKVKKYFLCLYCNGKGKQFNNHESCQQHMCSKSHCKLLYQDDDDVWEYARFYDFSKANQEYMLNNDDDDDEEDDIDDNASDASWETVSDSELAEMEGIDEEDDEDEMDEDEDADDREQERKIAKEVKRMERVMKKAKKFEVTSTGELMLLDGRTVGHRQYKSFYKQVYKPEDCRESIQAIKSELEDRQLALLKNLGVPQQQLALLKQNKVHNFLTKTQMVQRKLENRQRTKINLRTSINANKFHQRPTMGGG